MEDNAKLDHACGDNNIGCVLNVPSNTLIVFIKNRHFRANYCPFCGFRVEKGETDEQKPLHVQNDKGRKEDIA
jgi:hypothetical protein